MTEPLKKRTPELVDYLIRNLVVLAVLLFVGAEVKINPTTGNVFVIIVASFFITLGSFKVM